MYMYTRLGPSTLCEDRGGGVKRMLRDTCTRGSREWFLGIFIAWMDGWMDGWVGWVGSSWLVFGAGIVGRLVKIACLKVSVLPISFVDRWVEYLSIALL